MLGEQLCLSWLVYPLGADVVLSFLLLLKPLLLALVHNASGIANSVWARIQTRSNRVEIVVSKGQAVPVGESAIVVANHVAWTDFYLI